MLTRLHKMNLALRDLAGAYPEQDIPAEALAKAAAAMTRPRRSRQFRGGSTMDRQIFRVLDRQGPRVSTEGFAEPPFKPVPLHRGHARAAGTGESRVLFAERPGHGEGLWLMRGTVVQSKAIARRSHWYGGRR